MKNLEIYTYNKKELDDSKLITIDIVNDIKYIKENTIANLYLANTQQKVGHISYINNIISKPDITFNTSIGSIITPNGKLVFNFSYIISSEQTIINSAPDENKLLIADPTFKSDSYLGFNNLKISVQIIKKFGERILSIEYDNIIN